LGKDGCGLNNGLVVGRAGDRSIVSDRIRETLLTAYGAGRSGFPPDPTVVGAIADGSRELTLEQLSFDSLGWMEFCISVELQCGQELTPLHIEAMRYMFEIEDWLRARM
jgi:hypothetical protein